MAVGFMNELLKAHGHKGYKVTSAGTWTVEDHPPALLAVEVMAERGIDISSHRSHRLTQKDLEDADLVVVMTKGQKEALALEFPEAKEKIYLLAELAGKSHDIEDPYGTESKDLYQESADQIGGFLREGYERLIKTLERKEKG
jgi:protein-tyrosine phosphatase